MKKNTKFVKIFFRVLRIFTGEHFAKPDYSIITAGVTLGNHVIVAAGSMITRFFSNNVLIAGFPEKIIWESGVYIENDVKSNKKII